MLPPLPPSHDLAPCDFFLFPEIRSMLKGTQFLSPEEAKAKMIELLNSRRENGEHYMKKSLWSHERKMERAKKMKPEIIYDTQGTDGADQILYLYQCYK